MLLILDAIYELITIIKEIADDDKQNNLLNIAENVLIMIHKLENPH